MKTKANNTRNIINETHKYKTLGVRGEKKIVKEEEWGNTENRIKKRKENKNEEEHYKKEHTNKVNTQTNNILIRKQ